MLKRLVRDNPIVNPVVSRLLRFLLRYSRSFSKLTHLYRVYGNVKLNIQGVQFHIFTKADDNIANEVFYDHGYEADEFKLVKAITASARTFVDVGANTGVFTIFAAKANPELNVVAVEPHPSNYQRLQKNIALNRLTTVTTFPFALGQSKTTIPFTIPADDSLSTTASVNEAFATHFHNTPQKRVDVEQVTLDDLLSGYHVTSSDLIKIDVEYYELEVLKGSEKTLSEARPLMLVEILDHNTLMHHSPEMRGCISENHAEDIEKLFARHGYYPYALSEEGIYAAETVLSGHNHRNFLFLPTQLREKSYRYHELQTVFNKPALVSHG